jgi:hypothetical protein
MKRVPPIAYDLFAGVVFVVCFFLAPSAWGEKRVALVIGNSNYQNAGRLANPANDAEAVARLLRDAGFDDVDAYRDLAAGAMRRVVRNFTDKVRDTDIALVYYAGHGLEVDGSNYLIRVDAQLQRDIDVEDESVSLERVLRVIEPAKRLRLVILDACRDNPFIKNMKHSVARRALGRGLASIEPSMSDTLVAFAAKAGSTAEDGQSSHSPFTAALLKHLATPGLDVRLVFGRVRDEVLAGTKRKQEPFVYGSLGGADISLVPVPPQPTPADTRRDYEMAERVGTLEAWDFFLAQYATGLYANLARAQRAKLAAAQATQQAIDQKTAKQREDEERRKRAESERQKIEQEVRQREEAQRAEAAAAAQREEERQRLARQAAEQAERTRLENEKAAARERPEVKGPSTQVLDSPQIAMLPPVAEPPTATQQTASALSNAKLVRAIKTELKRIGCYEGKIDENWDRGRITPSLGRFVKYAKVSDAITEPTADFLDRLKGTKRGLCPVECPTGELDKNGRCVEIKCPRGRSRQQDGSCKKSTARTASLPTDVGQKKESAGENRRGGEGTCGRMKDPLGCKCALKVGGYIYASPGSYSGYRWRYGNREAFTQCLYAAGRR